MPPQFRCALAPFRVHAGTAPVHLFHASLAGGSARLFGFLIGDDPAEAARIAGVIHDTGAALRPAPGETFEAVAAAFFKQANHAIRDLPLKAYALRRPPVRAALVALASGNHLALAGRGALAFKITAGSAAAPEDLLGADAGSAEKTLFPTLVVGGLGRRDTVLLANRSILDYCAPAHLARLMNAGTPEATREALLAVLSGLDPRDPIAGVVVKVAPAAELLAEKQSPTDSLNTLLRQARDTEALLTPTFLPSLTRLFRIFGSAFERRYSGRIAPPPRNRQLSFRDAIGATTNAVRNAPSKLASIPARIRDRIKSLGTLKPREKFRLAAGTIIVALVILGSTGIWIARTRSVEARTVGELRDGISQETAAVEASMLYGDTQSAWQHLDAARALAQKLPGRTRAARAAGDVIRADLTATTRRLTHEAVIDTPGETTAPANLPSTPATEVIYNNRHYRLDTTLGMIFRAARSGETWGEESAWLPSPIPELKDGRAMAIASAVYVSRADGSVLKFMKGVPVPYIIGRTEPALQAAVRLIAPEESNFLYLLVPSTKRVVVLDRNRGELIAQYTSPVFTAPDDIAVDEVARIISIHDGNRWYSLPAAHIKQ